MRSRAILLLACVVSLPALAQRHPNVAKGIDPSKSYGAGSIDTINHFNGSLSLAIPVGQSFPISSRLSYGLSAHYNSNVWDIEDVYRPCPKECAECECHYIAAYPDRRSNCGMGWTLTFGRLYNPWAVTNETGSWVWESPNGSEHRFRDKLHDEDTAATETWYTRDGTYLRMRLVSATRRIIEFPDGKVHEYEPGPDGVYGVWRLKEIHDQFKNGKGEYVNWMRVDYIVGTDGATDWKITDSVGRTHYMNFVRLPYDSGKDATGMDVPNWDFVDYVAFGVTLDASGNVSSHKTKYDFVYEQQETARHGADTDRPVNGGLDDHPAVQGLQQVRLLDGDDTDLGHTFDMTYAWALPNSMNNDWSGVVTSATLPTRAKISWVPDFYHLPTSSADEYYYTVIQGIHTRTVTDPVSGTATWTYTESTDRSYNSVAPGSRPRELKNSVLDPAGNITEYYFNVITDYDTTWKPGHYGLPISPLTLDSDNSRYLSVRQYQSGVRKRSLYLRYQHDTGTPIMEDARNMRVQSRRTDFHDDLSSVDADQNGTNDPTYASADHTDFDGLGHYRKTTTGGTFATGNVRETVTKYNPLRGTYPSTQFSMLGPTDAWLLGTYSEINVTEGNSKSRQQFCFDANGSLTRQRALAATAPDASGVLQPAANDILEAFAHDASGNVTQADVYGGDGATLATAADVCTVALPSVPMYRTAHTHSHGVLATTTYKNPATNAALSFKSLNLTIDRDTGLITASADTAERSTAYSYDAAGRVKTTTPPGEVTTTYNYSPANVTATDFTPAQVTIATGSGTSVIESQQQFDGLGRLWREKVRMADGTWSVRETKRDGLGRVTSTSELEKITFDLTAEEDEFDFTPTHLTTFQNFDAFGRPTLITAPDDKRTTIAYQGSRAVTRTRFIAMTPAGETSVSVKEERDRQGRLFKLTENSGSTTDAITTTYGYDAAGRLTSVTMTSAGGVTQPSRTFSYDGRGFLTSEFHPESGTTTYTYDARGHMTTRDAASADLTFEYDKAERPKKILGANDIVLKEFFYDRANSGTDYSLGKLDYAIRHNHQAVLGGDIQVKETYTYKGVDGRLSEKKTEITPGGESFTDTYVFNALGALQSVTYPACTGCSGLTEPTRTVSNIYNYGFVTAVPTYASSLTYHPNGLLATIQHLNDDATDGPLYTQTYATGNGIARPDKITVTGFCKDFLFTAHPQSHTIRNGESWQLEANAPGATSYEWFTSDGTQIPGASASVVVSPEVTTTYYARATNGSCTVNSFSATVTVEQCPSPNASITAPAAMDRGSTAVASVPAASGASYAWTSANGTITAGANSASITFSAECGVANVELSVTVTASCGAAASSSKTVALNAAATATVSGSATIPQGATTDIHATLTGASPWTVTWTDEGTSRHAPASPSTRPVSPPGTTTFTLSAFSDAYGCAGTILGSGYVVTVTPPTPSAPAARAVSATRVNLTWSFSGSKDWFEIDRRSAGGYVTIGTSTTAAYADTGAAPNTAYLYRIRAVKSGTSSTPSLPDLATTIMFTDDPLIAGQTVVKALHVTELRTAVSAVRNAAGLPPVSFTDSTLVGLPIQSVHVQELRNALNQARSALFLSALSYTDQPLSAGVPIKRAHFEELRAGVK